MDNRKGTVVTLPKGSVIFQSGGAFELGGTTARLAADTKVEFDRVLNEDDLAAFFVAGGRPEFLQTLDGKFTQQGIRLENRLNAPQPKELEGVDAPELARIDRQKIEDKRMEEVQKGYDAANKRLADEESKRVETNRKEAIRAGEVIAEDRALAIDRDLRAKAAVADDETIKDDTERATDRLIYAETTGGEVRGNEASIGEVSPDDLLNIPEDKKISPDHDIIARETKAVESIGIENAGVAKAHKTGQNQNEVLHKDGTNASSVKTEISKEDAVENIDDKTDLAFLPTDPFHSDDKEVRKNEREVEKGKKETDKESTDTRAAEKVLAEQKDQMDKNKLVRSDDPKAAKKAKTSEQVDAVKKRAAEKVAKEEETKLPVKK